MSTQRGNCSKSGGQKYQNKRAFRNDLHNCNQTIKALNALVINGCCKRCKEVIEWKIKFKKYKQLAQPKKCVKCLQKSVKNSYYTTCQKCIESKNICGKCGDVLNEDPKSQETTDRSKRPKEHSDRSSQKPPAVDDRQAESDDGQEEDEDDSEESEYGSDEEIDDDSEAEEKPNQMIGKEENMANKTTGVTDAKIPSKHTVKFKEDVNKKGERDEDHKSDTVKQNADEIGAEDEQISEDIETERPNEEENDDEERGDDEDDSYDSATDDDDDYDEDDDDSKQTKQ